MKTLLLVVSISIFSLGSYAQNEADPFANTPLSGLSGLFVGPHSLSSTQHLLKLFHSDGCSMSPNSFPGEF